MKVKIKLNTVKEVQDFVKDMESFMSDVDVYKGTYKVDAKSILGVLSLDTSNGCEVSILTSDENELVKFSNVIKKWEV